MLTGQPTTISRSQMDGVENDPATKPYELIAMVRISDFAGQVVERNQKLHSMPLKSSLPITMQIEQDMEDFECGTPTGWWAKDVVDNERLFTQLCFHYVRIYCHLPYAVKSASEKHYALSRDAASDAARQILSLYQRMRVIWGKAGYVCRAVSL